MTEELEFVNDWGVLEAAINVLMDPTNFGQYDDNELGEGDCDGHHVSEDVLTSLWVIKQYVPRLLTQYANLVELSFALTEGWEQYVKVQAPSQLYLPDHR